MKKDLHVPKQKNTKGKETTIPDYADDHEAAFFQLLNATVDIKEE